MQKLVLFDIDGTLINPGGAGRRSMTKAFQEIFSVRDAFASVTMAGKTDIQIMKEGLYVHGLPSGDSIIPSIVAAYLKHLETEINNKNKHIQPGVIELLGELSERDGCWLGLLTGNIEHGARIKLGAFGLNTHFPFGAFGSDHEDRNMLLPFAVERFERLTNMRIGFADCVVIGDTPSDVKCSKLYGAVSIAVSTGIYSYESLLETEADYVLNDLTEARNLIFEGQ